MKRIVLFCLFAVSVFANTQFDVVKIGVLAKRGDTITLQRWQPTAKYLQERIANYRFEIVPLSFEQIDNAVRRAEIDFIIANSAIYVQLEHKYEISRIATLLNRFGKDRYVSYFGGVIFSKIDSGLDTIEDLKGKRFAAVDEESFGGWIMAQKLFKDKGITPKEYFASLEFTGTHDSAVYAVLEGKVDAATVRSDTIERMEIEGKIAANDLFIINQTRGIDFPFAVSTQLYPEWPIAKLPHTDTEIARQVALQLMSMSADSQAAKSAQIGGWTIPANYSAVNKTLQELGVGVYRYDLKEYMLKLVRENFMYLLFASLAIVVIIVLLLYVWRLNLRLRSSQEELLVTNEGLETTVEQRTQSIEDFLEKERYLRVIMGTISDINRYLITYKRIDLLLQKSVERLIKPSDYMMSFITIERGCCTHRWFSASKEPLQTLEEFMKNEFEQSKGIASHFNDKKSNEVINDVRTYDLSDDFRRLCLDAGVKACAFFALKSDVQKLAHSGVVGILSRSPKGFELEEIKMLEELSGDLGFAIEANIHAKENDKLKNEQIRNYEETIISFVKMIEQRDTYTAGHTARVAKYSQMIAQKMGISEDEIQKLTKAAILHDIGKISTPDAVLLKPAKLNDLEYQMIKEHVSVGYEMLKGISIYKELAQIMLHHHERYDGGGYPNGLKGEEIPLLSAIMSVADAFDAMTSTRIYKKSKSVAQAIEEISQLRAKQFHPDVVDAAVEVLKEVNVAPNINQNPTNEIERERLAYFYKDALTGFYNESYLKLMLNQKEFLQKVGFAYKVEVKNIFEIELHQGIKSSENSVKESAKTLQNLCEMTFFAKPAIFYLFCSKEIMQTLLKSIEPLKAQGQEIAVEVTDTVSLQKELLEE
jgi:phosphate/phosphite/phosphonate ABC transporter binding protein